MLKALRSNPVLFYLINYLLDAPDAMDMWRYHHARADWKEAHAVHGDPLSAASTPAEILREGFTCQAERGQEPRAESMQAGKRVHSAGLGEEQRCKENPSSPLPHTKNCILGHSHLTWQNDLTPLPFKSTSPAPSLLIMVYWFSAKRRASGQREPEGWSSLMSKD